MPLLDHFHPPLSPGRHWEGFHSFWASAITQQLNGEALPEAFFAEPHTKLGSSVEIDVGTFRRERAGKALGGLATEVYAPPEPALTLAVDLSDPDSFEIQVRREEEGIRLVAAIELISPANKDRRRHREEFVVKCAGYLREGVSVLLVDIVTNRTRNLYAELLEFLEVMPYPKPPEFSPLNAVACRATSRAKKVRLQVWPYTLTLGGTLPIVPIWLAKDLAVPLDLERSYASSCDSLRLPRQA
jgi:hypothetical protein